MAKRQSLAKADRGGAPSKVALAMRCAPADRVEYERAAKNSVWSVYQRVVVAIEIAAKSASPLQKVIAELLDDDHAADGIEKAVSRTVRSVRYPKLRGTASRARTLTRGILAGPGIEFAVASADATEIEIRRLRVSLTDRDLARTVAAFRAETAQHRERERRELSKGRRRPMYAHVATTGAGLLGLIHKPNAPVRLELAALDPQRRLTWAYFAPEEQTPLGAARDVVRDFVRNKTTSPAGASLGRRFLARRR